MSREHCWETAKHLMYVFNVAKVVFIMDVKKKTKKQNKKTKKKKKKKQKNKKKKFFEDY